MGEWGWSRRALGAPAGSRRAVWALAGLGAVCGLLLALSVAGGARAAFPGVNGTIAYDASGPSHQQLFSISPAGTGATALTADGGVAAGQDNEEPAWSPDGTRVAFSGGDHIWVLTPSTGAAVDLTPGDGSSITNENPSWLDNTHIVFDRIDFNDVSPQRDIYEIASDGTGETQLPNTSGANEIDPTVNPVTHQIAFIEGNGNLWTMNADGSNQTPLVTTGFIASEPDWSPDGSTIAFIDSQGGTDTDVWTIKPATQTTPTQLTATGGTEEHGPAWSPDGSQLVVQGETRPNDTPDFLYLVNASTGAETQIPNTSGAEDASWQPAPQSTTTTTTSTTTTTPPPPQKFAVEVKATPAADGSVMATISHGTGTCTGMATADMVCVVTKGSGLTLQAAPRKSFSFAHWAGRCTGTATSCTIADVAATGRVSAGFEPTPVNTKPLTTALTNLHSGTLARACASLTKCTVLTSTPLNTCQAAIGGNSAVSLVAVNGCLKPTGVPGTDANGNRVWTFTTSGPVDADGYEFAPTHGSITIQMYADANQQQHFQVGDGVSMSFEGLKLGTVPAMTIDPETHTVQVGKQKTPVVVNGVWAGAVVDGSGNVSTANLPIAPDQFTSVFKVISVSPPTFYAGKATVQVVTQAPPSIGGATSSPTNVSTGYQSAVSTASLPDLNDNGDVSQADNSCASNLNAVLPTQSVNPWSFPSISLAGFSFEGHVVFGDAPSVGIFEGTLSAPSYLDNGAAMRAIMELGSSTPDSMPYPLFACAKLDNTAPIGPLDSAIKSLHVGIVTAPAVQVAGGGEMVVGSPIPFAGEPYPLDVTGNWSVTLPAWGSGGPWSMHDDGNIDFAGSANATGTLDFSSVGYVKAQIDWSGFNYPSPLSGLNIGKGSLAAEFDAGHGWLAAGELSVSYDSLTLGSANVLISNLGIGGCGTILGEDIALSATYDGNVSTSAGSCNGDTNVIPPVRPTCQELRNEENDPVLGPYAQELLAAGQCVETGSAIRARRHASAQAHAAATGAQAAQLKGSHLSVEFVLHGSGGAPAATVAGPGNVVCSPTSTPGFSKQAACAVIVDPTTATTTVTVMHPQAGTWFVAPASGAPAIASMGVAYGLPAPAIHATISHTSGGRLELHYRGVPTDGRLVTFVEQGTHVGQTLGSTRKAQGTITFAPAPGPAGTREVIAQVSSQGAVRQLIVVARFHAAAPTLPAPRLRVHGSGAARTISIGAVRGATDYMVKEAGSDHRKLTELTRKRVLRVAAIATGTHAVSVTVSAIDHNGFAGHRSTVRVKLVQAPHGVKLPAYRKGAKHRKKRKG